MPGPIPREIDGWITSKQSTGASLLQVLKEPGKKARSQSYLWVRRGGLLDACEKEVRRGEKSSAVLKS